MREKIIEELIDRMTEAEGNGELEAYETLKSLYDWFFESFVY